MVKTGLQVLYESFPQDLTGARAALLANPASVMHTPPLHTVEVLQRLPLKLVRLFAPEHGLYAQAQEGVVVEDTVDARSGLPVVSLYGEHRAPTREALEGLDALFFDLQDVGVRVYTYLSSLKACLIACAGAGVRLVLLDRPNPLGRASDGAGVAAGYESFVGAHNVRFQHGMTLGELGMVMARDLHCEETLTVIGLENYHGEPWEATGLPWLPPSPNLPTLASMKLYPLTVFLEGTSISEGRGTGLPFQQLGAPWLDGERLALQLQPLLPGLRVTPTVFKPERSKHTEVRVEGVRLELTDETRFKPLESAYFLLKTLREADLERFAWVLTDEQPFVDALYGSDLLRQAVMGERTLETLRAHEEAGAELEPLRVQLY